MLFFRAIVCILYAYDVILVSKRLILVLLYFHINVVLLSSSKIGLLLIESLYL